MPRIRSIKPEFWQDEKLVGQADVVRLVFLGLISLADDAGRLLDKPVKIEADLFDDAQNRRQDVIDALTCLAELGVIRRGATASGQRIIQIANWDRHQKVDHPNLKAAFPEIVELHGDARIREPLATDSREPREQFASNSREPREPLAHHINDLRPTTNDQRPTNDDPRADEREPEPVATLRAPSSSSLGVDDRSAISNGADQPVSATDPAHRRDLAAAANRGLDERFGAGRKPRVRANDLGAKTLAEALAAEQVSLAFAVAEIEAYAVSCKPADGHPPQSLRYFLQQTLNAWAAAQGRASPVHDRKLELHGARGATRAPTNDVHDQVNRMIYVDYAERGDPDAIAYCEAHNIPFTKPAAIAAGGGA